MGIHSRTNTFYIWIEPTLVKYWARANVGRYHTRVNAQNETIIGWNNQFQNKGFFLWNQNNSTSWYGTTQLSSRGEPIFKMVIEKS